MKKIQLFLLIILFTSSIKVYGQGEFLEKGNNGAFSSFSYVSDDDASGWLGHLGFSYKGIIDLGIGYGKSALDHNYLNWSSVQYSFVFHLHKGDLDSIFVGFALSLSYSDLTYKSEDWVYVFPQGSYMVERTDKGSLITPALYSYLNLGYGYPVIIQFIGSIGFTISNAKNSRIKTKDDVLSYGFGLNLGIYLSPSILLSTSPAVAIVEDNTSWGINVGIVIITNKL